jgi:hypothetical protein
MYKEIERYIAEIRIKIEKMEIITASNFGVVFSEVENKIFDLNVLEDPRIVDLSDTEMEYLSYRLSDHVEGVTKIAEKQSDMISFDGDGVESFDCSINEKVFELVLNKEVGLLQKSKKRNIK